MPPSLAWQDASQTEGDMWYTVLQVVNEQYEQIVFSEPVESFYQRVTAHQRRPMVPLLSVAAHVTEYNPEEDIRIITGARQQVASITANIQRQLDAIPG